MHFNNIITHELMPKENLEVYKTSKLIVNTTSLGMYPSIDDTPTDLADSFNSSQIIFDLIYNPLKTNFIKLAEKKGAIVINGLKMFVVQGARSFELWTGKKLDADLSYEKLTNLLTPKL